MSATVTRSQVREIVFAAVAATFRVADPAALRESSTAVEVDGWNSLSHTMLLMAIEDQLGFELALDGVYAAADLGALVDIITAQVRARARATL